MNGWLLDTNVLSESSKQSADRNVLEFLAYSLGENYKVASITMAEIRFGVERLPISDKRLFLEDWVRERIDPFVEGHDAEASERTLVIWKGVLSDLAGLRRTIDPADALRGATAIDLKLVVASRDTLPFRLIGVPVLNPWTGTLWLGEREVDPAMHAFDLPTIGALAG